MLGSFLSQEEGSQSKNGSPGIDLPRASARSSGKGTSNETAPSTTISNPR